jgi:magnesium chelatase subunit D
MPPIERVVGCFYNCAPDHPAATCEICNGAARPLETTPVPFVNLPLGASEDRVLGSLDFERALKEGRKAFQPGLLAAAHRGILYIDEVNLLPDHLVDVLLDAAAMGVNRVQREGLSIQHPARIALLGTMNQEEGELRPQLLDRFGLMVEVRAPLEPSSRAEIVRRRLAWEADPQAFNHAWCQEQTVLRERVLRAQALLPEVVLAEGLLSMISELCCSQGVTSLRADLVMNKAARARAALDGRTKVRPDDLSEVALLVLPHRRRTKPFERPGLNEEELQRFMQRAAASGSASEEAPGDGHDQAGSGELAGSREARAQGNSHGGSERAARGETPGRGRHDGPRKSGGLGESQGLSESGGPSESEALASQGMDASQRLEASQGPGTSQALGASQGGQVEPAGQVFAPVEAGAPPRIQVKSGAVTMGVLGRRSVSAESRRGREVRAVPEARPSELAVTATLHHSLLRTGGLGADGRPEVTRADLHQKVRSGRQGNLILFVVDASGSMAALRRMQMVKGAVLALLRDAYQRRDEVGVIAFRGTSAELLLPPTRSVETAERQLRDLPTGGRTPLAHALRLANEVLVRATGPSRPQPLLILLSDGRANVSLDDGPGDPWEQSLEWAGVLSRQGIAALVLDTEVGYVRMGRAGELAEALGARCMPLEQLGADSLSLTIRSLA